MADIYELEELEKELFHDQNAIALYRSFQLRKEQTAELAELDKLAAEIEAKRLRIQHYTKLARNASNIAMAAAMLAILSAAAWLPPLLHTLWPEAWGG